MNIRATQHQELLRKVREARDILHDDPNCASKILKETEFILQEIESSWEKTQLKMAKNKVKESKGGN